MDGKNGKGGRIKVGPRSTIREFEMTGAEFYRMVQTIAHYEEKFSKVVNAEGFNGGKEYKLFGFDISSIQKMCETVEEFLHNVEIGGKA